MDTDAQDAGLALLCARLCLDAAAEEQTRAIYAQALAQLRGEQDSSPSLLQDHAGTEDVQRVCVVWLLRCLPSLLAPERAPAGWLALGELLGVSACSLLAFFKEAPVVISKLRPLLARVATEGGAAGGLPDNLEAALRLREWQETLSSLSILSNKYKDLFWHVQRSAGGSPQQQLLRAGWCAFLLIKAALLPGFPDLVSCLELLVCVLNLLLASSAYEEPQLRQLQSQSPGAIDASGRFNTLKALCQEARVDYAKAKALMPQIEARFRSLLEDSQLAWLPQPLPAALPHPQAARLDTGCGLFLPGLLANPQQLSELVMALDAAYEAWFRQQGEIDEREFLLTDFGALASPRTLPGAAVLMPGDAAASSSSAGSPAVPQLREAAAAGAAAVAARQAGGAAAAAQLPAAAAAAGAAPPPAAGGQQQQQQQPVLLQPSGAHKPPLAPGGVAGRRGITLQGLQSPLPLMHLGPPVPATPVSQTMDAVHWLRGLARELPLTPPPSLGRFLDAAGADAGSILLERVQAAAAAVFLRDAAAGGGAGGERAFAELQQGVAQERRDEGMKLYWHVLEAMLTAEDARAGLAAAGNLLSRWSFHQCLLACAFELVAASYRMGLLSFPAIPAKLGLKPFDLCKLIGPFVRAEPTLPRELKRHMFTVEEKILESLGWAPGSSFYRLMRAATGQLAPQHAQRAQRAQHGPAAAASPRPSGDGEDAAMQDSGRMASAELASQEAQPERQAEQAQAAAADAAAAAAARGGEPVGTAARKRHSEASGGDAMETDTPRTSCSGAAGDSCTAAGSGGSPAGGAASKRQRSTHARPQDAAQQPQPGGAGSEAAAQLEQLPLPRALGAPPGTPGAPCGGDPAAQAVLHDYARKVLKLAAFRLVAVSEGLDFAPMEREDVVSQVHELLSGALYGHTYLFYSRHLDTLLLACLYGFCKVNRLQQITFREIIAHYKRQAHAKQEVFRTVVLQQTDPGLVTQSTGDVIAFYNAVFVPAMKSALLTTVDKQAQQGSAGSHPALSGSDGAVASAATSGRAASAPGGEGSVGAPPPRASPIQTALLMAAQQQQQQQQQRSWCSAAAGSPASGGSGSAYRALSLGGAAGATSLSLGALSGGGAAAGSELQGLSGSGLSLSPHAAALQPRPGGAEDAGGLQQQPPWAAGGLDAATAGDGAVMAAAAAVAAQPMSRSAGAGKAAAITAGGVPVVAGGAGASSVPSRLSRLTRPQPQQPGGEGALPKLAVAQDALPRHAASSQPEAASAAAADSSQQHDQDSSAVSSSSGEQTGRQRRPSGAGSDSQAPSGGGGGRPWPAGGSATSGDAEPYAAQRREGSRGGSGSPAGLVTLLARQALDANSGGGSGGGGGSGMLGPDAHVAADCGATSLGHLARSCGQQQQAVAMRDS